MTDNTQRLKDAEAALKKYADAHNGWVYGCPIDDFVHTKHTIDCVMNKFVDANGGSVNHHGYFYAQEYFTKYPETAERPDTQADRSDGGGE